MGMPSGVNFQTASLRGGASAQLPVVRPEAFYKWPRVSSHISGFVLFYSYLVLEFFISILISLVAHLSFNSYSIGEAFQRISSV